MTGWFEVITPDDAQDMAGLWREGKVVQIDGASHMIHYVRFEPIPSRR